MADSPSVLALAAHPDDIEFMMAGTMIRLRETGWKLHYMNIANGNCGTAVDDSETIVAKRLQEARDACDVIGAVHYPPLCNDLEVYHTNDLISRVVAVMRTVRPRIVLTQSPEDYMEDHMNAARIAVTAAFCRGMRNFPCVPHQPPVAHDVTIYHALPYGLRGPMRQHIVPELFVDVTPTMEEKRAMLACHRSQKEWLDESQGLNAYLDTMAQFAREVGAWSRTYACAEGWRRRSHLGFSAADDDPLADALGNACQANPDYETTL